MKVKGINRVAIVVKDIDGAVALYSKLLNTTFYPIATAEEYGTRTVFSYEPGIEITSPIAGSNEPMALALAQHIKEHGEGLYAVVFDTDDVEQAGDKAEEMGVRVLQKLEASKEEAEMIFQGRYSTFIEYMLNPEDTYGAFMLIGHFQS